MSKIRTTLQLQSSLDQEISWRMKEIANLKVLVRSSDTISKKTAVRAAMTVLYAHWEGFIKNSATMYLDFVNGQRLTYNKLQSCFIVFGVKRRVNELIESKTPELTVPAVDFIRNEMGNRAKLKIDSAIRTESNLSSTVFNKIALSIGFDTSKYEARYNLIDESLLDKRNHIAHGEYLDVDSDSFRNLADEILYLLKLFKTDIENSASLGAYKI